MKPIVLYLIFKTENFTYKKDVLEQEYERLMKAKEDKVEILFLTAFFF